MITAQLKIDTNNPTKLINSLKPDMDKSNRFEVELAPEKNSVILKVEAKDLTAMRAAINSYLRLIQTINEVDKID